MSEYLYDEDYSPADDQEEARLWPLVVVILAIALAALFWPLYRSEFKRYLAIYRPAPEPYLVINPEVANGIRQICENPQNSHGSMGFVFLDKNHDYAGQGSDVECELAEERRKAAMMEAWYEKQRIAARRPQRTPLPGAERDMAFELAAYSWWKRTMEPHGR